MPFKLKLKKSRQYNVVSKNVFIVSVELLDNTVVECTLSAESTGQDCLNNVCQRLGLQQIEFFGLRFSSKRFKRQWVELDKSLKKQLDKYAQETYLYLGVMFYIGDVSQLHDDLTRYHYFLQLKADIIDGRLPTNQEQAVQLASYSLQAEFGDHDPERHTAEYLKGFRLLPKYMSTNEVLLDALTENVVLAHRNLLGLSPAAAEIYYIGKAQQIEEYGQEAILAKDDSGSDVQLATSLNGIHVINASEHQSTLLTWDDITQISLHKRTLTVECKNSGHTFHFQLEDAEVAKYIWKLYVQQHQFYSTGKIQINNDNNHDLDKYVVKMSENHNTLNQLENLQRLHRESCGNLYQRERRRSTEELHMNFSHSDTGLYEEYQQPFLSGSHLNTVLHTDSIYSVNSLGQSAIGFNQNFNSSSSLNVPSVKSSNPHLRALLPSYRLAPDYETAIQHKYGNHSASLGNLNGIQSYLQDMNRTFTQQNIVQHQQQQMAPTKSYYHYKNFTDLANLDTNATTYYSNNNSAFANLDAVNSVVPHRAVDRLTPVSNLMLAPTHTYSTPELTSQGLRFNDEMIDSSVLHYYQYKPPPPYPYNQRSSASTPDLASQTLVGCRQNNSSPDLLSHKRFGTGSKMSDLNGVETHAILEHGPVQLSGNLCDTVDSSGIAHPQCVYPEMATSPNGYVNIGSDGMLLGNPRSRASSVQSAPEVIVTVPSECDSKQTSVERVRLKEVDKSCSSPTTTCTSDEQKVSYEKKAASKVDVRGYGPMMVAAMNGLTLSRPDLISKEVNDSRAPKDARRQMLENQLAEGLVFNEFDQILKKRPHADYTTAVLPENAFRNRFKDVLPYEDNRVRLSPNKDNRNGYINASHISVSIGKHQRFYIAAQGPLPNTVNDFWQMVWEQQVQLIVMLTEVQEQGRNKCFPYWPKDNNKIQFGDFSVTHKFSTKSASYTTTSLCVDHVASKKQRTIWHIQYTDWPDHGCPDDVHGFLNFMEEVHCVRRHASAEMGKGDSTNSPVLVHCSAGVGRSGVTILTDIMLYCLDYNENIDVPKILTCLRQQRMLIVQTVAQYKFIYSVLIQYLKNSRLI